MQGFTVLVTEIRTEIPYVKQNVNNAPNNYGWQCRLSQLSTKAHMSYIAIMSWIIIYISICK